MSYLNQLSIKNFILLEPSEILDLTKKDYFMIHEYKSKSLSNLVKDFLSKNIEEQLNLICLILIFEEEPDIQNMAYLLYDMITNESFLLKPNINSNTFFANLHWSLQKKFKILTKKYNDETSKLTSYSFEELSYEKDIFIKNK